MELLSRHTKENAMKQLIDKHAGKITKAKTGAKTGQATLW